MREALVAKTAIINEISSKMDKSQSLVVVEYAKLKVLELEEFRNQLRQIDAEMKIYKNNLFNLVIKDSKYKELKDYLVGPNAFIFSYKDELASAKLSAKFSKQYPALQIKAGIYDNNVLGTQQMLDVALLPSKEELLATFAILLKQPLIKFALTIKELITKLEMNKGE